MKTLEDVLNYINTQKQKVEMQIQGMDQDNLLHKLDQEAYYRALEDVEEFIKKV